jgi:hypothetical protein
MYHMPPQVARQVPLMAAMANESGGTVLLESQYNRFLADSLVPRYWVMDHDQPGMLEPWHASIAPDSYREGLLSFINQNAVKTIVLDHFECPYPEAAGLKMGWEAIVNRAAKRHRDALCSFADKFKVNRVGEFVVLRASQ